MNHPVSEATAILEINYTHPVAAIHVEEAGIHFLNVHKWTAREMKKDIWDMNEWRNQTNIQSQNSACVMDKDMDKFQMYGFMPAAVF